MRHKRVDASVVYVGSSTRLLEVGHFLLENLTLLRLDPYGPTRKDVIKGALVILLFLLMIVGWRRRTRNRHGRSLIAGLIVFFLT
jgi:hypothetical protein